MSEINKTNHPEKCTALIPLRRMNPFSAWRILQFLLQKLKANRKEQGVN